MRQGPSKHVCVFCGSRSGQGPTYVDAARKLGEALAVRDIGVVYGGASVGAMGALADGALAAGGEVIGVIPESLLEREVAHHGVTDLRVVRSMHERKAAMADLSEAFVALPGGIGTLEELFEIWTWSHLRIHAKPIGLLNVNGFFDSLLTFADQLVAEEFLVSNSRALLIHADAIDELLARVMEAASQAAPGGPSELIP